MPEGDDATIEVCNIMSFVLYTQILKQSVLKPASPGITLRLLKCDDTPKCDDHAEVQWLALKCDGMTRESTMVHAKVRWYDALKCDGLRWRERAMVRHAKVRWSQVTRKCDGMPR